MSERQVWISIFVIAAVTALLRFLPFVLFREKQSPAWLTALNSSLPYAAMGMLVVYCLRDVSFASVRGFVPAFLALLAVGVTFVWKRNTLLSILVGTVGYMVMVQLIFV